MRMVPAAPPRTPPLQRPAPAAAQAVSHTPMHRPFPPVLADAWQAPPSSGRRPLCALPGALCHAQAPLCSRAACAPRCRRRLADASTAAQRRLRHHPRETLGQAVAGSALGGCVRRAGAGAQGSRSVKWKVDPRSAADSTQIVPPISSARRREIARPRPGRAPECSTSRALAALVMNYSACMALHQRRNTQQRCRRAGHSRYQGPRCRAVPWAHAKAGLAAAHPCRRTCGSWTRGPAGSTGTASSWSRPRCRCPCRGS